MMSQRDDIMDVKFTLRTSESVFAKFKYIAKHNGRSANRELDMLIREHIAMFEQKHGAIRPEDYEDYLKLRSK